MSSLRDWLSGTGNSLISSIAPIIHSPDWHIHLGRISDNILSRFNPNDHEEIDARPVRPVLVGYEFLADLDNYMAIRYFVQSRRDGISVEKKIMGEFECRRHDMFLR